MAVKLVAVNELVVLAIGVPAVARLLVDDSHLITLPVLPLKFNTVLFVPVQTVVLLLILPPTLAAVTVICPDTLLVMVHPFEFVTTQ